MARRAKTWEEVERMKAKAVRFLRDVVGDEARAEEVEQESPQDYAERKRIKILDNPAVVLLVTRRLTNMAVTKAELEKILDQIEDLADEALDPELCREEVVGKVKAIADLPVLSSGNRVYAQFQVLSCSGLKRGSIGGSRVYTESRPGSHNGHSGSQFWQFSVKARKRRQGWWHFKVAAEQG